MRMRIVVFLVVMAPVAACLDSNPNVEVTPTPPRLDAVEPAQGPAAGGTVVTLTGVELADGTALTVLFADAPAWVRVIDEETVEAIVPPSTVELPDGVSDVRVDVSLTNAAGSSALVEGYGYACTGSEVYCSESCTDLDTSNDHCGSCGSPCLGTCVSGVCMSP